MKIAFPMTFHREGDATWVQGEAPLAHVFSQGDTLEEARANAREALTLALAAMLEDGHPIPRPPANASSESTWVAPESDLIAPLVLRWAREDARLTQAALAKRLSISKQAIQKLERPGANPSIKTLARIAAALGHELELSL